MSNRDYYGSNVPAELTHGPSTNPPSNYTSQQSQGLQTQQAKQEQWTYAGHSDTYDPNINTNGTFGGEGEGERGLGATVLEGAGGAFVGHKVGKESDHGTLGAIGGAVAGAVVANLASNMVKGKSGHGIVGTLRDRRRERLERRLDRLG
ncbi:hypothetical protein BJX63DRAFT_437227 [Aspergillus granulosus]|uniref:Glycine zipper 2TM domain-containing protein n=1 Tax=Aspergillus granulosus TaxID=176169 RepID=A0ABR4GVN5_9EURO